MASTSAVTMASMPIARNCNYAIQNRVPQSSFFNPLKPAAAARPVAATSNGRFKVKVASSSMKEKIVTGLTAGALTASIVIPDVAQAAEASGVSPSLKNFLFSIVAGGVVLTGILGAIVGVSNFDPVSRG